MGRPASDLPQYQGYLPKLLFIFQNEEDDGVVILTKSQERGGFVTVLEQGVTVIQYVSTLGWARDVLEKVRHNLCEVCLIKVTRHNDGCLQVFVIVFVDSIM